MLKGYMKKYNIKETFQVRSKKIKPRKVKNKNTKTRTKKERNLSL